MHGFAEPPFQWGFYVCGPSGRPLQLQLRQRRGDHTAEASVFHGLVAVAVGAPLCLLLHVHIQMIATAKPCRDATTAAPWLGSCGGHQPRPSHAGPPPGSAQSLAAAMVAPVHSPETPCSDTAPPCPPPTSHPPAPTAPPSPPPSLPGSARPPSVHVPKVSPAGTLPTLHPRPRGHHQPHKGSGPVCRRHCAAE